MSDTYELTVHGLLRKRADMAGEAETIRARLSVALSDLDRIDAVIRLFKPDIEPGDLPTRATLAPGRASRGEVQRHIFDVLRAALAPMTTRELTRAIMERRSMNADDRVLFNLILRRAEHTLAALRRAGRVQSNRASEGALLRWRAVA